MEKKIIKTLIKSCKITILYLCTALASAETSFEGDCDVNDSPKNISCNRQSTIELICNGYSVTRGYHKDGSIETIIKSNDDKINMDAIRRITLMLKGADYLEAHRNKHGLDKFWLVHELLDESKNIAKELLQELRSRASNQLFSCWPVRSVRPVVHYFFPQWCWEKRD